MKRLLRAHCQGTKLIICYYILFLSLYMQLQNIFVIGYYPLVKNLLYLPFLCQKKIYIKCTRKLFSSIFTHRNRFKIVLMIKRTKKWSPKDFRCVFSHHWLLLSFSLLYPRKSEENLLWRFFFTPFLGWCNILIEFSSTHVPLSRPI